MTVKIDGKVIYVNDSEPFPAFRLICKPAFRIETKGPIKDRVFFSNNITDFIQNQQWLSGTNQVMKLQKSLKSMSFITNVTEEKYEAKL